MIWLYLSFAEELAKFIVNYHVLSPFLSAKNVYLLLHFSENSAQLLRVRVGVFHPRRSLFFNTVWSRNKMLKVLPKVLL